MLPLARQLKGSMRQFALLAKGSYIRGWSLFESELDIKFSARKQMFRWVDLNTYTTFFGFNRGGYSYVFGVPQETLGATAFLEVKNQAKDFHMMKNLHVCQILLGRRI